MTQFTERAENKGYELIMASPFEVGLVKNGQGIRTWWLADFDGQMPKLDHPLVLLAISINETEGTGKPAGKEPNATS